MLPSADRAPTANINRQGGALPRPKLGRFAWKINILDQANHDMLSSWTSTAILGRKAHSTYAQIFICLHFVFHS